ncbi:hypothetical protein [Streptomyces xantholiticus]
MTRPPTTVTAASRTAAAATPSSCEAVQLLARAATAISLGLLCTIDVANDSVTFHDALMEPDPPRIDFLLLHATWDESPRGPDSSPTTHADRLHTVFDRWDRQGRRVPVCLFESVLSTLSRGPSLTESLGVAPKTSSSWRPTAPCSSSTP